MEPVNRIINTSVSDYSVRDSGAPSTKNHKLVESQAERLVSRLNRTPSPEIMPFYYKVCYKLTESKIESLLEIALGGRNPAKYFSFLASKELGLGQFRADRSENGY